MNILIQSLHEKCPNTEFFLVRIFPHSDWKRRYGVSLVFNPNGGKYGPQKNTEFGYFSRSESGSNLKKKYEQWGSAKKYGIYRDNYCHSPVTMQKCESQTKVMRKQSTPNFPKNEHFLPPWYLRACIGGIKC